MADLILASKSPRRKVILDQLGVNYEIIKSPVDDHELAFGGMPEDRTMAASLAKVLPVAKENRAIWCLGADTIVVCDDLVLGQPEDEEDAREMLRFLSGKEHEVYTGIALVRFNKEFESSYDMYRDYEVTKVRFAKLDEKTIENYVATGDPLDKAGAYGIQGIGGSLITGISGCFFNVMGLPLNMTARYLKLANIPFWQTK